MVGSWGLLVLLFASLALSLFFFLPRARDAPCNCRSTNAGICSLGASGVLFRLLNLLVSSIDSEAFMDLVDKLSFHRTHALLPSGRLQEVDWSKTFCVEQFLYFFCQGSRWMTWSNYGTWPETRNWLGIFAIQCPYKKFIYLVFWKVLPLSCCCIGVCASWWWGSVTRGKWFRCYFYFPLLLCW